MVGWPAIGISSSVVKYGTPKLARLDCRAKAGSQKYGFHYFDIIFGVKQNDSGVAAEGINCEGINLYEEEGGQDGCILFVRWSQGEMKFEIFGVTIQVAQMHQTTSRNARRAQPHGSDPGC
jgi:hypothetical protein